MNEPRVAAGGPTEALALLEPAPSSEAPRHRTLLDALERAAREGHGSVRFDGRDDAAPRSFATVLEDAARWSRTLRARGVSRGDRVPLLMSTGPAFVGAFFGAQLAGAIPVPLAAPMTFGSVDRYFNNLARVLRDADAHMLVTTARLCGAAREHPALRALLRDVITEADLVAAGHGVAAPSISPDDTAFLQYTSGTTGAPKGVVISHRAAVANAQAIAAGVHLRDDDVAVSWLPMFHDMGLIGVLLTAVCHPYAIHLMSPEAFVMRPERWLSLVSEARATITVAPNFAYDLCVARANGDVAMRLESLRLALNGAEPVLPATAARFGARYAPHGYRPDAMLPVYGMAENTLAVTFAERGVGLRTIGVERNEITAGQRVVLRDRDDALRVVSVGRPVRGTTVAVCGPDDNVSVERAIGEVWLSGASLMDGYFRQDALNADTLCGGWMRTGDLGFVHAGELYVVGRAKEMIIKGGRNVYPYDLERVAAEVPGVRAGGVAAFGRPNPDTGTDDVVVVAETLARDEAERARIARAIRGEILAAIGVRADDVLLWPAGAIPRTTSGKVQRGACARRCAEASTGGRA